jgi:G3E family GTPase
VATTGQARPTPITVIGGYLGAGKTTLVNHLLRHPGGRRLGVIVNDFGTLAIDADLLAEAAADGADAGVIGLPNGCVCCTVGAGLHEALGALLDRSRPPDHIVIEVSGVADPAVAAGWATVPPFEPGGVVVLAAADSVRRQARDRFVGGEVLRQLAGADLIVLTKTDLCGAGELDDMGRWLDEASGGAPMVSVVDGDAPVDLVLGVRPAGERDTVIDERHTDRYVTWTWSPGVAVGRQTLDRLLAGLPAGVLRMKGSVLLTDGTAVVVDVVGRRAERRVTEMATRTQLVAIGVRGVLEPSDLDLLVR